MATMAHSKVQSQATIARHKCASATDFPVHCHHLSPVDASRLCTGARTTSTARPDTGRTRSMARRGTALASGKTGATCLLRQASGPGYASLQNYYAWALQNPRCWIHAAGKKWFRSLRRSTRAGVGEPNTPIWCQLDNVLICFGCRWLHLGRSSCLNDTSAGQVCSKAAAFSTYSAQAPAPRARFLNSQTKTTSLPESLHRSPPA